MRVERIEHIYLSDEDNQLWADFGDLLCAIQREIGNKEIKDLINHINMKLFDLSDFLEDEE